ncbi:MAG: hypothetical protein JW795_13020 [Chitinivibrionales bacterium]|nr:hypothetical protein [Chitinivibrionales bacterium]
MSRKKIIMLGMVVGSIAGGYVPTLFHASSLSFASLIGGTIGALVGIYIAFKIS